MYQVVAVYTLHMVYIGDFEKKTSDKKILNLSGWIGKKGFKKVSVIVHVTFSIHD